MAIRSGTPRLRLEGQRFGNLVAVEQCDFERKRKGKNKQAEAGYLCKCDCGKDRVVTTHLLTSGSVTSCGCSSAPKDLTGQKFGDYLVIKQVQHSNIRDRAWLCRCKCGFEKIQATSCVVRSTRCRDCKNKAQWKGIEDLSQNYWNHLILGAKTRNLEFNITIEFGWDLFLKQGKRCALSGVSLVFAKFYTPEQAKHHQTASLDRILQSRGYVVDNVQWVHKEINWIKGEASDGVFIDWCEKVAAYQKELFESKL